MIRKKFAAVLATVDNGLPDARSIVLREIDARERLPEIAATLDLAPETVKHRIRLGLHTLRGAVDRTVA